MLIARPLQGFVSPVRIVAGFDSHEGPGSAAERSKSPEEVPSRIPLTHPPRGRIAATSLALLTGFQI